MTAYPPFSGQNPPCAKCEDTREKGAKAVSYGRAMRAPNGRLMFVHVHTDAEDLHLVRSCSNCGWEWEERCADDRDGDGTVIREAQA